MILISLDWGNRILVIGVLNIICALISLVLWLIFSEKFGFFKGKIIMEDADTVSVEGS
jgi:hypothetical protein